jgi:hypothetical protein
MGLSLKPHQLVAHWIPGAFPLILIIFSCLNNSESDPVGWLIQHPVISLPIFAILAFVVGQVLDSFRDLCEWMLDLIPGYCVNWDFFVKNSSEEREKLEATHFTYYVFNMNLAIVLIPASLLAIIIDGSIAVKILLTVPAIILTADALVLRKEIVKHTNHAKK